jgi:hypothetical protein
MAALESTTPTPARRETTAPTNSNAIAHPLIWGGQLPTALASKLLATDKHWVGNFWAFLEHPAAPEVNRNAKGVGPWVHNVRANPAWWSCTRQLALLFIKEWQQDMYATSRWATIHDLIRYGQMHHHTAIVRQDDGASVMQRLSNRSLGNGVHNIRQSWAAYEGRTKLINYVWHPKLEGIFSAGLPGFAKKCLSVMGQQNTAKASPCRSSPPCTN